MREVISLREYKRELRERAKLYRKSLTERQKADMDSKIAENLLRSNQYKKCTTVFTYASSKLEINTRSIIERAFLDGKNVAVPRCTDNEGEMTFHYITSFDDLQKGAYSIDEPNENLPVALYSPGAFMIVPAFVIDRSGYRIGYGKGYYDRYLAGFFGQTVGLCYSKSLVNKIDRGRFDRSVDVIITELGIKTVR